MAIVFDGPEALPSSAEIAVRSKNVVSEKQADACSYDETV
jgi:hypothetical protein